MVVTSLREVCLSIGYPLQGRKMGTTSPSLVGNLYGDLLGFYTQQHPLDPIPSKAAKLKLLRLRYGAQVEAVVVATIMVLVEVGEDMPPSRQHCQIWEELVLPSLIKSVVGVRDVIPRTPLRVREGQPQLQCLTLELRLLRVGQVDRVRLTKLHAPLSLVVLVGCRGLYLLAAT